MENPNVKELVNDIKKMLQNYLNNWSKLKPPNEN